MAKTAAQRRAQQAAEEAADDAVVAEADDSPVEEPELDEAASDASADEEGADEAPAENHPAAAAAEVEETDVAIRLPHASDLERASVLQINDEATAAMTVEKAASLTGVSAASVVAFAVRGNAVTGTYVVVVRADDPKVAVRI